MSIEELKKRIIFLEHKIEGISLELTRLTDILMGLLTRYEKIDDELKQ